MDYISGNVWPTHDKNVLNFYLWNVGDKVEKNEMEPLNNCLIHDYL